ncbi:hypothetical protein CEXT_271121 [Caerostris extrusa]|uniref:Uncharacterized protein n=1 Tax=Caerostris extrusa TaxID=172846 RepID=A0AAV4YDH1_CAEEX|nr:hypothetical protein CEXT_271121 [Caerostris extrusa]
MKEHPLVLLSRMALQKNHMAMDGVRAMLQDSELQPTTFWGKKLSLHLFSLEIGMDINYQKGSSIEILDGHKPVDSLKNFGSLTFVYESKKLIGINFNLEPNFFQFQLAAF